MNIIFRVDASIFIGIGHVMRCLTLAEGFTKKGYRVEFICRTHDGNMINLIEYKGFVVHQIKLINKKNNSLKSSTNTYSNWLGCSQIEDAESCVEVLKNTKPDLLIVDHYAIGNIWHDFLKKYYKKLMVIDDLADRKLDCDFLLDQTYGRDLEDYQNLVPERCQILVGSKYSLLRDEFAKMRNLSLRSRLNRSPNNLLISMGGVDLNNVTGQILDKIKTCGLKKDTQITVVVGQTCPHIENIMHQAQGLPYKINVLTNVNNMAEIMTSSDFAIGGSGATTWERACLGLPSIQIVIAENQRFIAERIDKNDVAISIQIEQINELCKHISNLITNLRDFSVKSSRLTDGTGVKQVLNQVK